MIVSSVKVCETYEAPCVTTIAFSGTHTAVCGQALDGPVSPCVLSQRINPQASSAYEEINAVEMCGRVVQLPPSPTPPLPMRASIPPFMTSVLLAVLTVVAVALCRDRGRKRRASTALLVLPCLFVPGVASQCSSAPTCSLHASDSMDICWLKNFADAWAFDGGASVVFPGRGLYQMLKVSKDESNCCYELEVQAFMCEVLRDGEAVSGSHRAASSMDDPFLAPVSRARRWKMPHC